MSSIISHEYVVQNLENENKIKLNLHTTVRCSPIWKNIFKYIIIVFKKLQNFLVIFSHQYSEVF